MRTSWAFSHLSPMLTPGVAMPLPRMTTSLRFPVAPRSATFDTPLRMRSSWVMA